VVSGSQSSLDHISTSGLYGSAVRALGARRKQGDRRAARARRGRSSRWSRAVRPRRPHRDSKRRRRNSRTRSTPTAHSRTRCPSSKTARSTASSRRRAQGRRTRPTEARRNDGGGARLRDLSNRSRLGPLQRRSVREGRSSSTVERVEADRPLEVLQGGRPARLRSLVKCAAQSANGLTRRAAADPGAGGRAAEQGARSRRRRRAWMGGKRRTPSKRTCGRGSTRDRARSSRGSRPE